MLDPHLLLCRPKPETLKRRALEAKAAQHSAKGVRGAARTRSTDQKPAGAKAGSSFGRGKAASTKSSPSFGRSKAVGSGSGGPRKGPFAMSATISMSSQKSEGASKPPGGSGTTLIFSACHLSSAAS